MFFKLFEKKTLIYTAFGHEQYLKIVGKLSAAGIVFTTKSRNYNILRSGHNTILPRSLTDKNVQYDIYVKKEIEHKAYQAIQKK